jgi:hypothetical protein
MARCIPFVVSVAFATELIHASAAEPIVRKPAKRIHISTATNDEWYLGLIDGDVGFLGRWRGDEDDQKLPLIPSDQGQPRTSFTFLWDYVTLQIRVQNQQKAMKIQADRDQWYLTAQYGEKGPRVTFTKEQEKRSRWEFVPVEGRGDSDIMYYYIKNINDLGKNAWLGVDATGVRYRWHDEVRKAKLSFNDKQIFAVEQPSK